VGDTFAPRAIVLGRRFPRKLRAVPFDPPLYDTFAFIHRRGERLSPAARELIEIALAMVRSLDQQIEPLEAELRRYANSQPACRALQGHFGIGPVLAVCIFAEIGDARRFSSSRKLVRLSGLDITVYESADKRQPGRISRQGAPLLRWAMVEAAQTATRHTSPDRGDYLKLRARLGHNRAAIEIARRMLRRCHHTLVALGDDALAPVTN
jgi:transposase